jgi:hypothetical protein
MLNVNWRKLKIKRHLERKREVIVRKSAGRIGFTRIAILRKEKHLIWNESKERLNGRAYKRQNNRIEWKKIEAIRRYYIRKIQR